MNCVGLGLVRIVGALASLPRWVVFVRKAIAAGRKMPRQWTIVMFLAVGLGASMYVFQVDSGQVRQVIPGARENVGAIGTGGDPLLAAAHRGAGAKMLLTLAIMVAWMEAVVGLLMLNKSAALLPLCALMGGLAMRYGMRRVIIPGLATVAIVFLLIAGPVNSAPVKFGILAGGGEFTERSEYLRESFTDKGIGPEQSSYNTWSRLCYMPSEAAALYLYDSGQGGDDYKKMGWVFVPRLLFPSKPIISSGGDFNRKVTGIETSASAPGVLADGYYNLGWFGLVASASLMGLVLAMTSALSLQVLLTKSLLWLPAGLMGAFMAFRLDGHFVNDIWGPFGMLVILMAIGYILSGEGDITCCNRALSAHLNSLHQVPKAISSHENILHRGQFVRHHGVGPPHGYAATWSHRHGIQCLRLRSKEPTFSISSNGASAPSCSYGH